jgi:hypothetical protein
VKSRVELKKIVLGNEEGCAASLATESTPGPGISVALLDEGGVAQRIDRWINASASSSDEKKRQAIARCIRTFLKDHPAYTPMFVRSALLKGRSFVPSVPSKSTTIKDRGIADLLQLVQRGGHAPINIAEHMPDICLQMVGHWENILSLSIHDTPSPTGPLLSIEDAIAWTAYFGHLIYETNCLTQEFSKTFWTNLAASASHMLDSSPREACSAIVVVLDRIAPYMRTELASLQVDDLYDVLERARAQQSGDPMLVSALTVRSPSIASADGSLNIYTEHHRQQGLDLKGVFSSSFVYDWL